MNDTTLLARPLIASILAIAMTACSSSSIENPIVQPEGTATNGQSTTDGADVPPVTDTNPTTADNYELDITLTGDLLDGIVGTGSVLFTVWGYDKFVADVSATPILETSVPVKPLSETYELRFTSSDLATTEYQTGSTENLGYYMTFNVDANGDGQICNGDYRQNYDSSALDFYTHTDYQIDREISVSLITNIDC